MDDYKRKTIESYDQNAQKFSKKFERLTGLKKRYEFERFIALLSGRKILDLGCGAGDHSRYFIDRGLAVDSIDLSREMIALCKEKGLNAQVMDIEALKFEDDFFDGIWAVTSLLHIPKKKLPGVIRKLSEILKANGVLYVCVKEGTGESLVTDKRSETERFFSLFELEELKRFFLPHFDLIEAEKARLKKTTFLLLFFRKASR